MYGRRIIGYTTCSKVRHQLFIFEFIQRKTITRLAIIFKTLNIGNYSRINFQLNITSCGRFTGFIVFILKIKTRHTTFGNDIRTETERSHRDNSCRYHIRTQHALKTHSRREHCDNFRILRQLGSEKDYCDKDKQWAEQIGKVGNKVHIVIENNSFPWSFMRHETVHLLIKVEYYGDRNNQGYGKHICPQELLDDVPIQPLKAFVFPDRQFYFFQYLPVNLSHNLVDTRCTIIGFHVEKSPAIICLRASPTSQR